MDGPNPDFFSFFDLLVVRIFLSTLLVLELFKVIKGRLKSPPKR
jgi:hypothetical protein